MSWSIRDVDPMLALLVSVCDVGSTTLLCQLFTSVLRFLLGFERQSIRWTSRVCCRIAANLRPHAESRYNVFSALARRWADVLGIVSAHADQYVAIQKSTAPSKHGAFTRCCFNVGPSSSTLTQHWNIIGWIICWRGGGVCIWFRFCGCASPGTQTDGPTRIR